MGDFTLPALGADMESGKVVEWLVKAGDHVRSGDVVAIVETHKGAIDVECFLDGVIENLAPAGIVLPVGAVLARVGTTGSAAAAPAAAQASAAPAPARTATAPDVASPAAGRAKVSPAARRRALELGLAADTVPGTGGGGAVTLADVERAASRPAPPLGPAATPAATPRGFDPTQMRQAIAAAMSRSKREIPHYYLATTIDFAAAQAWVAGWNRTHEPPERLLPAVMLLKACAKALREVPQFNGFFEKGAFRAGAGIHVGWAIALRGGGLVAPAIRDSDLKPLPELMQALRDCVQRARIGRLRSSELTDPTVTVTSLGDRGADAVFGVIYPPQVAILGFGQIVERPWVVNGEVVPRPLLSLSLAADHRASDGHLGGRLLAAIDAQLQAPERL